MIQYVTGDILNADVEAIVNTVNCVGVMGRGIALQFKNAFPENFEAYAAACAREAVQPGKMFVYETEALTNPRFIINFPTKRHWKGKSKIEDIESGLRALIVEIKKRDIRSIAIPPLGAGLGGLEWSKVRERIEAALGEFSDRSIIVYEPYGAPELSVMARTKNVPKMTTGRAALVTLMYRYLGGLLDPFVTLLEVHKLMYFLQEAGQPLKLRYIKHIYGPYSENLRHVLSDIEGHLVAGYADGGDQPDKPLQLVPGAVDDAKNFLQDDIETKERFDRVSNLVRGYETPFGLELLSTVHWVAKNEQALTPDSAVAQIHTWNDRKKRFNAEQIAGALTALQKGGWV